MNFRRLLKILRLPWVACLIIGGGAAGLVCAAAALGWLQRAELIVHDQFIRWQLDPNATDERIAIVGMTEDDLVKYGFPIGDAKLAELLERIDAQEPCVIGLDLYRDLPEPRDGSQYPRLETTLKKLDRVIAITRYGYVDPPKALEELPERISANNLKKDTHIDGVYRRAPLFIEIDAEQQWPSLSLKLAYTYLEAHDVPCSYEPGADGVQLLRLGKTLFPRLTKDAGGYVDLPHQDYEFIADFHAPQRHRHGEKGQYGRDTPYDYSFGEVFEGKVPAGALKGKIVLVATVMQSIKDSNPTPVDDNLRGVQYHAMLVHQLLEAALHGKPPPRWWPDWAERAWIAVCTLLGGVLSVWLRSPWKLVPALALLLGAIVGAAWLSFTASWWILAAAPGLGALLAAALVTSYVVVLERADRNVMNSLLAKHVSKKVADVMWEQREHIFEGGKMAPRAFTGTVIFTDLAGFSTASEKLTAVQVMRWLNAYMEVMAKLVERYEGTINKYIGDAIMGVFGAPIVHETEAAINLDVTRAIRCALHMRREVPVLNAQWRANSPDMPSVAMRVGIFTGPLVHGSFGHADRMEWTVIGDTVNRANRLEAAGKEIRDQLTPEEKLCSILIGPESFARVGHLFHTVEVPDMPLKGISERATVYRVLSERAEPLPTS